MVGIRNGRFHSIGNVAFRGNGALWLRTDHLAAWLPRLTGRYQDTRIRFTNAYGYTYARLA